MVQFKSLHNERKMDHPPIIIVNHVHFASPSTLSFEYLNRVLGVYVYRDIFNSLIHMPLKSKLMHFKVELIGYELSKYDLIIFYQAVNEYGVITNTDHQIRDFLEEICSLI
jgi:hypothetical protein